MPQMQTAAAYHYGADIGSLSQFTLEDEVLFPPCTVLAAMQTWSGEVDSTQEQLFESTGGKKNRGCLEPLARTHFFAWEGSRCVRVPRACLLQGGTGSADAIVASCTSEAKVWLATVLRNVNANQEVAAQQKRFDGSGSMNMEAVRQRLVRTFTFVNRIRPGVLLHHPRRKCKAIKL